MKIIRLYGELGSRFGREHHLDVKTPAEAVRALCATVQGFRAYLHEHGQDYYKVFVAGRNAADALKDPCSDKEVIRIAPVVQGASAVGRIILGAVLIALAVINPGNLLAANIATGLFGMGASMVLGGVIELLTPQQKVKSGSGESAANTPSYNFNGPVNTTAQGHPVPLAYGRIRTGSAVISAGLITQ